MQGMLLMVFIYWGWDTTTSINEETEEPGGSRAAPASYSTFLLLGTYILVVVAVQAFAGIGTHGIGLGNPAHINDVLSTLGGAIFGSSTVGSILSHLLLFMVLTSAAATTQTTILPNARTTLSMAFHKALPAIFGRIHPRYKTPSFSTISFGVISIIYYVALNFVSGGAVIADAVDATVFFAALYLGITAIACFWHYREFISVGSGGRSATCGCRCAGGVALFVLLAYSFKVYWDPNQSYFTIKVFGITIGGTLVVVVLATIVGLVWMLWSMRTQAVVLQRREHAARPVDHRRRRGRPGHGTSRRGRVASEPLGLTHVCGVAALHRLRRGKTQPRSAVRLRHMRTCVR